MTPPGNRDELYRLQHRLAHARVTLAQRTGEARHVAAGHARLTAEIAALRDTAQLHEKAAGILAGIADTRQADTQRQIETLVTQGLRTIFGDELSFHMVTALRAKRPEVDFVVRSTLDAGTVVETDVMDARGGGLAATVGFLLNLVVLLLSRPQDTVLFLDETFAHVSAEYEPRLAEFLRELVDKTGVQIIMVTHSEAFSDAADVRYRFTLRDGVTGVTSV